MLSTLNTLLGRLISLQIFQAATLPNVPSHVAKSAHSSLRLKIPSFVQHLFNVFETFHIYVIWNLSFMPGWVSRPSSHPCPPKQGIRPSKKATNINDVKRYLNVASIATDGLLVVPRTEPLSPTAELIVVLRSALHGLITALHVRLDHPTTHQLNLAMMILYYRLYEWVCLLTGVY